MKIACALTFLAAGCLDLDLLRVGPPDGGVIDLAGADVPSLTGCDELVSMQSAFTIASSEQCHGIIDTYLSGLEPDTRHDKGAQLLATSSTLSVVNRAVILLRFDLSPLTRAAKDVTSAQLHLGVVSSSPQALMRTMVAPWDETATWNHPQMGTSWSDAGCSAGPYQCGVGIPNTGPGVFIATGALTADVTPIVKQWVQSDATNNGFVISFDDITTGDSLLLTATEAPPGAIRPSLDIVTN